MPRMNIMFYNEKTYEQIILPINPESVEIPHTKTNDSFNILGYGEVNVMGDRELVRITLEHFLPDESNIFSRLASIMTNTINTGYNADKVIKMLKEWDEKNSKIRVVIDTDINRVFEILSFFL